jgi:hypothetical protein
MAELPFEKLAWRVCNGRTIFLDIAGDRYFRLPAKEEQEFHEKHTRGRTVVWWQPENIPRPAMWLPPSASFAMRSANRFSLPSVAAALWVQRRIEKRLAALGFEAALLDLARLRRPAQKADFHPAQLASVVQAFWQARLLRTAADRCLPGSLALIVRLASVGIHANLVIGVRDEPFGAHCWAQHGTVVLNDSLEETHRYEPILVV